ncbi:twin-arginine translocation signal domain-containing protein [Pyxidicoccus sp. 3LFB2]
MKTSLTRRALLRAASVGGAALAGGQVLWPSKAHAVTYIRTGWQQVAVAARTQGAGALNQLLWVTLMRMDNKLAAPINRYYLWVWTHDARLCRLFTAPNPEGPWTQFLRNGVPGVNLPPAMAFHHPSHFSSGDVVWDAQEGALYSTPHTGPSNLSLQWTTIIRSTNGVDWEWVQPNAIVPNGPLGSFDDYQVCYGRVLRDYDGNVVRRNGKLVFYYRGEHSGPLYSMGAATGTTWDSWQKVSDVALYQPLGNSLHGLGSALDIGDGKVHHVLSCSLNSAPPFTHYHKESNSTDPFDWSSGPGLPLYGEPLSLLADGPSYIIGHNGTHYMAYASLQTDLLGRVTSEVRVLRALYE